MEIKIQIFSKVYSLCFGHKTKWFEQEPFICLIEEFFEYNDKTPSFAKLIFKLF